MAAFGTVKPGFEKAAELQFPQQFSREYARRQLGLRYAPSEAAPTVQDYVGTDFQADYHAQKRADAQKAVLTGVSDTRRSVNRALVSHAGYYGMPAPVRSQRRIGADVGVHVGANALYGAGISNAAPVVGLEGGVIGSREGRVWTKNALQKRIAEFDAIDAAQAEGPTVQAAVDKGFEPGQAQELDLNSIIAGIRSDIYNRKADADTLANLGRLSKALVEFFAVPDNYGELDTYRYEIDQMFQTLRDEGRSIEDSIARIGEQAAVLAGTASEVEEQDADLRNAFRSQLVRGAQIGMIVISLKRLADFLDKVGASLAKIGTTPTPQEARALARNAAKSAQIGKAFPRDLVRRVQEIDPEVARTIEDFDAEEGSSTFSTSTSSSSSSGGPPSFRNLRFAQGSFTPDGLSYERTNGPSILLPRTDLEDVNRNMFGRQGRPGEFRGERNYFGEDTDQSSWRPGIDIVEEVPRGFTNVVRGLSTDVDYKEAEQEDEEADKLARVRDAAEGLGISSLADIEEAVDEMPAAQARTFLNRIAVQLRSAYEGKPTTASRDVSTAKSQINQLLTAAYR